MSCGSEFILFGLVEHLGYAALSVLANLSFQPLFLQVFFLLLSLSFWYFLFANVVLLCSTGLLNSICLSLRPSLQVSEVIALHFSPVLRQDYHLW